MAAKAAKRERRGRAKIIRGSESACDSEVSPLAWTVDRSQRQDLPRIYLKGREITDRCPIEIGRTIAAPAKAMVVSQLKRSAGPNWVNSMPWL